MFATVAVGTDGSATASKAVDAAADLARRYDARLVLLSAFQDPGWTPRERSRADLEVQWSLNPSARVREILSRTEQDLRSEGIECITLVDEGDPSDVIVRLAGECEADVLVIGNKGMRRRVLGSVPNTVTHKAPCSVLVVKTT
jgi:nucleotide-binding universal stress UspA family protein